MNQDEGWYKGVSLISAVEIGKLELGLNDMLDLTSRLYNCVEILAQRAVKSKSKHLFDTVFFKILINVKMPIFAVFGIGAFKAGV